jgi:hypothetical protein
MHDRQTVMPKIEKDYWGEGRAVYRRPDVPTNTKPSEFIIIETDEEHKLVAAAVSKLYKQTREAEGQPPDWLNETKQAEQPSDDDE